MHKIVVLILISLSACISAMQQTPKSVNDDSLLHRIIKEMSIGLHTALNGIRMPGNFNPDEHLAVISTLVAQGAPLASLDNNKETIIDAYWCEQKCNNASCQDHTELFGKLLTAILISQAGKARSRKEQRALYTTIESQLEHLLTGYPTDQHLDQKKALQLLKKSAHGLPMPPFSNLSVSCLVFPYR